MRVIFVTFHYRPANEVGARRPTALSEALAARGHPTTVISSFGGISPNLCTGGAPDDLRFYAVPVRRRWILRAMVRAKGDVCRLFRRQPIKASPKPSKSGPCEAELQHAANAADSGRLSGFVFMILGLVDGYKMWSWRAATTTARIAKKTRADIICCSGPPMSSQIAAYIVSKRRHIPLIVDLRDPWVVGTIDARRSAGFPLRVERYLERRVLFHAAAITVTADYLAEALARAYPMLRRKIQVVRNGYDGARRPAMRATGHRLSILFAGELYLNRNPFGFLEAVERLLSRVDVDPSRVELVFIGICETFRGVRLRDWLRGKRCDSITQILPPVRANETEPYIERATLLINFAQGSPTSIPAKTYDHMASGREMLIFCESDSATARLTSGIAGVCVVDPRVATQLDSALEDLYRRHVVEGVPRVPSDEDAAPFSRSRQNESFVSLVEGVYADQQGRQSRE